MLQRLFCGYALFGVITEQLLHEIDAIVGRVTELGSQVRVSERSSGLVDPKSTYNVRLNRCCIEIFRVWQLAEARPDLVSRSSQELEYLTHVSDGDIYA